jgi:hypothetical protein
LLKLAAAACWQLLLALCVKPWLQLLGVATAASCQVGIAGGARRLSSVLQTFLAAVLPGLSAAAACWLWVQDVSVACVLLQPIKLQYRHWQ